MPEFFIHCGLHKTGTTALQYFLARNSQALLDAGLHYPGAGTNVGGAHHNLAWEFNRDRRFVRRLGNIELMLRQAAAVGKDTVISSEDFESALLSPERWTPLVDAIRGLGFSVTFVVYLREPASYLRSLFLENIKHGCGDEFGVVARAALERGTYSFDDWTFQFDYDLIARQMARVAGARVVFRSFEHLVDASIIPDFLALVGREVPSGGLAVDNDANLQASPLELLKLFMRYRHSAHMPPIEQLVEIAGLMLGGREAVPTLPRRLTEVFRGQRASAVKHAVEQQSAVSSSRRAEPSGDWRVNISRLFSWETQVEAMAIYEQAAGAGADRATALRAGDQAVFEGWRNWVAAGL